MLSNPNPDPNPTPTPNPTPNPNPNPNPNPSPNQAPTVPLHEIALALRTMLGEIGEEDGAIILATIDPELGESPEDRPASLDEVLLAMMARPG